MKHIEYAYATGMDDGSVDERLRTADSGVLALANGNDAYAVPLAHYYDGDSLYFRLGMDEKGAKRRFLETTETACYVLYGTDPTDDPKAFDSWSLVVTGQLVELSGSDRERFDTAEINDRFSPIRVFDEAIEDIDVTVFRFDIERITGRSTDN